MSFDVSVLPEQIRDSVKVVDKGDRLEVQHGYIEDKQVFGQVYDVIVKTFGGRYFGYYGEAVHYEIPKNKIDEAFKTELPERTGKKELEPPEGTFKKASELHKEETIPTPEEEGQYNLKLSHQKLGPLVPRILDAHGHTVDGFHRKSIDENWPTVKADWITDPIQLNCARLASNFARRTKWTKDDIDRLNFIAQTTSWTAKEIAENIGISHQTVLKLLADRYKKQ